jgi:hypothetical protein
VSTGAIMPMSEDERRELQQLEAQLAQHRRSVKLARRLSSASVDTGLRRTAMFWGAGAVIGLILIVAGAVTHSTAVVAAGVMVLSATVLVSGVAVFIVEIRGQRRERESAAYDEYPHEP